MFGMEDVLSQELVENNLIKKRKGIMGKKVIKEKVWRLKDDGMNAGIRR